MIKTVLCHFYNEEYLLPFWLKHHKKIFDNGIMINYASTDRSVEIIKEICPTWKIVDSRNEWFDAPAIDTEIIDYERDLEGWRMTLNVTEFLCGNLSVLEEGESYLLGSHHMVDTEYNKLVSYDLPLIEQNTNGISYQEEFWRRARSIHKHPVNYPLGRHFDNVTTDRIYICYYGDSPMNDKMVERRCQIQNRIPQSNKDAGWGIQHLTTPEKVIERFEEARKRARPLNIELKLCQKK